MSSPPLLRRACRRRHAHGAVMVEAAVVVTVLAVFLGVTAYVHRRSVRRIDDQAATRFESLSYASHDCEAGPSAEVGSQRASRSASLDAASDRRSKVDLSRALGHHGERGSERAEVEGALGRDGSIATAERRSKVSERSTDPSQSSAWRLEGTVQSASYVMCNQRARETGPEAMIDLAMGAADGARHGGLR